MMNNIAINLMYNFAENNGILSGSSVTMHESFKNLINKVGLSFVGL